MCLKLSKQIDVAESIRFLPSLYQEQSKDLVYDVDSFFIYIICIVLLPFLTSMLSLVIAAGLPQGGDCVAKERRWAAQRQAGGEQGGRQTRGAHP